MDGEWIKKNAERTGKCGDGLTWWQLGGDLYIEGQGTVDDTFIGNESIRNVVIAPGCTGIGESAFFACDLENVELPETLKHIGDNAFSVCTLRSLAIPDSVTEIGWKAFEGVEEILYNGCAQPEWYDDNWGAGNWNCDPVLRFRNSICRKRSDAPQELKHREGAEGRLNAYAGCVRWKGQIPAAGTEMDMYVESPFSCPVGGLFCAVCNRDEYYLVQAKLLSVLEWRGTSAKVRVQILQIKDMLASIEPVSEKMKAKLREQPYVYYELCGCTFDRLRWDRRQNLIHLYDITCDGSFDGSFDIYTDEDDIDHCVWWEKSTYNDGCDFVQDRILGFRKDSPYQWENELFLDRKAKAVLACRRDAKEVIIPDGIVSLKCHSFMDCPELEQITIPASVTYAAHDAFPEYVIGTSHKNGLKSLKRLILIGESKIEFYSFPRGVDIIRIP